MDPHIQTRPAQRSRASLIVLITLAFLLMIAAGILVFTLPDDTSVTLPTQTSGSLIDASAGFAASESEAQQLYPFGSQIIKLGADQITCLDIHGAVRYSVDVEFSSPMAVWNNELFLAADRGGHSFVLLNASGEIGRGQTEGQISSAGISASGYLAVIQDQTGGTGLVSIYKTDGWQKLFDCYNPESGYVLSVAFPPSGDSFDLALVNTAGSAIKSVIKRYGWDGSQLGQRIPDVQELLPLIVYDPGQHPVLCGTTSLVSLAYDKNEINWQMRFSQIYTVRSYSEGLLLLAREKIDGPCRLYSITTSGTIRFSLPAGETNTSLETSGNLAAVGCGTRIIAADCHKGKIILDSDLATEIVRIGFSGPRSLTIVSRQGVRRLNIPE
jgi:hypothetical protein